MFVCLEMDGGTLNYGVRRVDGARDGCRYLDDGSEWLLSPSMAMVLGR